VIDHLVFAAPDLDEAVALIEERLGVRAAPGGKHVGRGTHNALLSFGGGAYLEIIAPDPEQGEVSIPLPFGLEEKGAPRLATWAAKAPDIERRFEAARAAGYEGQLLEMSRELPDGTALHWSLAFPPAAIGHGVAPFLIRWEPGPHPSETSPGGCELLELRGDHPDPESLRTLLAAMGVDIALRQAAAPALIATVRCPNGVVELR
jgi:catechol 2,3-dioxygenase-like lactoylglutathione lyase family enzyme